MIKEIVMDKSNFMYIYYFPQLAGVQIKVSPYARNHLCLDISEVWNNKGMLNMLYPGAGELKDIWDDYKLKKYTLACAISRKGVLIWDQSIHSWVMG